MPMMGNGIDGMSQTERDASQSGADEHDGGWFWFWHLVAVSCIGQGHGSFCVYRKVRDPITSIGMGTAGVS
jgi:hypothetical protein